MSIFHNLLRQITILRNMCRNTCICLLCKLNGVAFLKPGGRSLGKNVNKKFSCAKLNAADCNGGFLAMNFSFSITK